jgi:hypothetical protein
MPRSPQKRFPIRNRGPSIAAVLNDANHKVDVENVHAHGFKYNPPILPEKNA